MLRVVLLLMFGIGLASCATESGVDTAINTGSIVDGVVVNATLGVARADRVEVIDSGAMVHLAHGGVGIVWTRSTERTDRTWTVDLPDQLAQHELRSTLLDPVDTGPCPSP